MKNVFPISVCLFQLHTIIQLEKEINEKPLLLFREM